ncbi:hypothetical protein PMAYCL1PPCAC_32712, partial [Pristionchus mayeri]
KVVRHVFTVLSVLCALPALIIILLCSNQVSRKYSAMIASIVAIGVCNDIMVQLVWDAIVLLPATCLIRYSVQSPGSRWKFQPIIRNILIAIAAITPQIIPILLKFSRHTLSTIRKNSTLSVTMRKFNATMTRVLIIQV